MADLTLAVLLLMVRAGSAPICWCSGLEPQPVGWRAAAKTAVGKTLLAVWSLPGGWVGAWACRCPALESAAAGPSNCRTVSLLPWALPTTVMALGWRWIFNDPFGPINLLLAQLGLPTVSFLGDPSTPG